MSAFVEESRRQHLEEAAAMARGCVGEPFRFLERYYRHVATEDLMARRPEDLVGAALSHQSLALHRGPGTPNLRFFTPSVEEDGWSTGHSVLEVVTDDMPFLVDSVTAELGRQDRAVHLIVHPQLVVRRDAQGRLLEVLDADVDTLAADAPAGVGAESWIHVEVDRESDLVDREELERKLVRVLADVRLAVQDWPAMRARAHAIVSELKPIRPQGSTSINSHAARRF